MIVVSDGESGAVGATQNEATLDRLLPSCDFLIHAGSVEPDVATLAFYDERAIAQFDFLRSIELELGLLGIGTGC
jgi:hypothetical protein